MGKRQVYFLIGDKEEKINFKDLKPGMVFKMYENENKKEVVCDNNGCSLFTATSFPYINKSGIYEISVN